MPKREPKTQLLRWKSFNPTYGPWYRLILHDGSTISGGEAVVMPDMDKGRWYWYVRTGPKNAPIRRESGHEPTVEEAKRTARAVFDDIYR